MSYENNYLRTFLHNLVLSKDLNMQRKQYENISEREAILIKYFIFISLTLNLSSIFVCREYE